MAHTPGPWIVGSAFIGPLFVSDRTGLQIAHVGHEDFKTCADNAELIAAAPEMLADLQWIVKIANASYEGDDKLRADGARSLKRIAERARSAIAKATGQQG